MKGSAFTMPTTTEKAPRRGGRFDYGSLKKTHVFDRWNKSKKGSAKLTLTAYSGSGGPSVTVFIPVGNEDACQDLTDNGITTRLELSHLLATEYDGEGANTGTRMVKYKGSFDGIDVEVRSQADHAPMDSIRVTIG